MRKISNVDVKLQPAKFFTRTEQLSVRAHGNLFNTSEIWLSKSVVILIARVGPIAFKGTVTATLNVR